MRGRTLLFVGLIAFLILGLSKVFYTDTSNPEEVIRHYLSSWQSENGHGMYPLVSSRAKAELTRMRINDVVDYYANFAKNRGDLVRWSLESRHIGQTASRFKTKLQFRDMFGKQWSEEASFYLVLEHNGWRVDGWQSRNIYALP